jgi:hypothetical protein
LVLLKLEDISGAEKAMISRAWAYINVHIGL